MGNGWGRWVEGGRIYLLAQELDQVEHHTYAVGPVEPLNLSCGQVGFGASTVVPKGGAEGPAQRGASHEPCIRCGQLDYVIEHPHVVSERLPPRLICRAGHGTACYTPLQAQLLQLPFRLPHL